MSTDMIDKEKKMRNNEKLYMNLRDVLSKQPDPRVAASLDKVQSALRKRGEKLKVRSSTYSSSAFRKGVLFFTQYLCYRSLFTVSLTFIFTTSNDRTFLPPYHYHYHYIIYVTLYTFINISLAFILFSTYPSSSSSSLIPTFQVYSTVMPFASDTKLIIILICAFVIGAAV